MEEAVSCGQDVDSVPVALEQDLVARVVVLDVVESAGPDAEAEVVVRVVVLVPTTVDGSVAEATVETAVTVVGAMLKADCGSSVSPAGSQTVPGAHAITSLHWPEAQRWKRLDMQNQAPSLSPQGLPTSLPAPSKGRGWRWGATGLCWAVPSVSSTPLTKEAAALGGGEESACAENSMAERRSAEAGFMVTLGRERRIDVLVRLGPRAGLNLVDFRKNVWSAALLICG